MGIAPRFLANAAFFLWSTRGLTGLPYVLLGSVAEHVLREAGCDVLVPSVSSCREHRYHT